MAVFDILLFLLCTYVVVTADYNELEFYIFYVLGALPPACAAVMLLISGQTNTARKAYFITWVLRYFLVVIVILIYGIFFHI